jgi:hypothetical protein
MLTNRKSIRIVLVLFTFAVILSPNRIAHADIGPKPTMSFEFVFPADTTLTITDEQLLQCAQPDCSDAQPIQQAGPQHFSCDQITCSSMAYGYTDYNRLSITFSDGVTRQSNIFEKKYFEASYTVTVLSDSLIVEEQRGGINPMAYWGAGIIIAGIIGIAAILSLIVCLVIFIVKEGQGQTTYRDVPALYIVSWVAGIPLVCLGITLPMSLPMTIGIEAGLMLVYLWVRKRPILKTLTVVLLMNFITLPFYWLIMIRGNVNTYTWVTLVCEILVVIVEGLLLYLTHRKTMHGVEAFTLALIINIVSFGVGLLLPISQWLNNPY